jgi:hypothetical protein
VEANSTGGQGSLRAVAPSYDDDDGDNDDDDDDDDEIKLSAAAVSKKLLNF